MEKFNVLISCDTTRAYKLKIIIDEREVGKIGNGTFFPIQLEEGNHTIYFKGWMEKTKPVSFEVKEQDLEIEVKWVFRSSIEVRPLTMEKRRMAMSGRKVSDFSTENISKVKLVGTRTGQETKILATYNFTVYSFLVIYKDGSRQMIECTTESKEFDALMQLADVD